jgi:hypothetical protein
MNVVGNNDLCGTVPTELGTGDDNGKSNSYYFHLFYCYEIDTDNIPIYVGSDNTPRYIPSLYKFGRSDFACIMVNSELTEINCRDWFKAEDNDDTINIYTGYTLKGRNYVKSSVNKYIYEILYQWFKKAKIDTPNVITACHEMPFTVITNANLTTNNKSYYRSKDNSSDNLGLVGSHLN